MNRRTRIGTSRWKTVFLLLLGAACSDSGGVPGGGSMCPGCSAWAGGETTDFETDWDDCAQLLVREDVSDSRARDLGFEIEVLRGRLTRDFTESHRWTRAEDPSTWSRVPPSGYSEVTEVRGSTRVVGVSHRFLDPELCLEGICVSELADQELECPPERYDGLLFELEVALETDDGAIAVHDVARSWVTREDLAQGTEAAVLSAPFASDLTRATGHLILEPDRSGPRVGELYASLHFHPSGVRGYVQPWIHAPAAPDERDPVEGYWEYRPLSGRWPDDGCSAEATPVDEGTDAASLALLNEHYPTFQAAAGEATLLPARWADGETTSISLEFGEAEPLCISAGEIVFRSPVHWRSSDGIVDLATTAQGAVFVGSEDVPTVSLEWSDYLAADDPLWGTGLSPLDLHGGTWAWVDVSATYGLVESRVSVQGKLTVSTILGCDLHEPCDESKISSFPTPTYCLGWTDPLSSSGTAPCGS